MGLCVECHGGVTIIDVNAVQKNQRIVLADPAEKATIQEIFARECDAELGLYCRDNCPIGDNGTRACAAKILDDKVVR